MKCVTPVTVKRGGRYIAVPCGKCPICLSKRRFEWSLRLFQEARYSKSVYFCTLTYSDDNLVFADGFAVLQKEDLQRFFKRLRKKYRFRYYACGEYGTNTYRPHYHCVFFFDDVVLYDDFYNDLCRCWNLGFIQLANSNIRRLMYVTEHHVNPDKKKNLEFPEFCLMSRRPGLGFRFIEDNLYSYQNSPRSYLFFERNKVGLPRYFRDKFFKDMVVFNSFKQKLDYEQFLDVYGEDKAAEIYEKFVKDAFELFQYKSYFNNKKL